jgi:drug/metabolite transporter superfamily protein YnfA
MRQVLPLAIGAVLVAVGGVWTLQGLGYLAGSPMTGVAAWAVIGPLVAGLGVALMIVGLRGTR